MTEPMLATNWEPEKTKLKFPIAVQPKIDGFRCLVQKKGDYIHYRSRSNREFPHLYTQFNKELDKLFEFLPGVELDGEIYLHGANFSQLSSIVRTEKKPHELLSTVKYYIFDLNIPDLTFSKRDEMLRSALDKYISAGYTQSRFMLVPLHICVDKEQILSTHAYYTSHLYEGTIIRNLDGLYFHGRSKNLMKYKSFIDEECHIIGVMPAKGKEIEAALLIVRDIRGNTFAVRPSANFETRRDWLTHPETVIDKKATITYQELSTYGVPRFPAVKAIRDYE